jgi:predicted secreted protein
MEHTERKIILVPHCFMTKRFATRDRNDTEEILKVLFDFKTGILQMPCPHLSFLINQRDSEKAGEPHCSGFIKEVKSNNPENLYAGIINPLLIQIEKYKQLNFEITGIIGIKGSPVCGIYNPTVKEYGSFIILLNKELRNRGIHLRMAAI